VSLTPYSILDAGDRAIVIEFGDTIDRGLNACVNMLDGALMAAAVPGIVEAVPTFRSLMIHFDPLVIDRGHLISRIAELAGRLTVTIGSARQWVLPVCYSDEMAPDLEAVSVATGISVADIVELHCSITYHAYMLGFLPGQPYLGDNPPVLTVPRRPVPRSSIPAGSVGIAMAMTSIFPRATPCGWHLIGRCPVPMWGENAPSEPLLRANDQISFRSISNREFDRFCSRLAERRIELTPEGLANESYG